MKTIREFKYNKSLVKKNLLIGSFIVLVNLVLLYFTGELIVTILIGGIVILVIAMLKSKLKVIKIFENHFELRLNIIAPVKLIQNKRLVDYCMDNDKFIISYISYDGTVDTIAISENSIEKNDFDDLLLFLITIKEENSIRIIHNHEKNTILKEAI